MDTVAQFITRIRNATMARHEKVDVPSSNMRTEIARVLKDSGFIRNFKVVRDGKQGMMRVYLKYTENGQPIISQVKRMSRPGRRYYVGVEKIPVVRSGFGATVLSTSRGIMSGEDARKANIGGEVLFKIW